MMDRLVEGLAWTLPAGVILTGTGSLVLAIASVRNPIEVGSKFNPASQDRGPIENVRALHRAARRTASKSTATLLLSVGLFLQAFGIGLQPTVTVQDWLLGVAGALIVTWMAWRHWKRARQEVLDGAGSWVVIGSWPYHLPLEDVEES